MLELGYAAFGFVAAPERLPSDPRESLGVVFPREVDPACSLPSGSIPVDNADFGAPVVHGKSRPRASTSPQWLTVREVAAMLRVCTATVYSLCESGKLPHTRVSTAIRIHRSNLAFLIQSPRKDGRL